MIRFEQVDYEYSSAVGTTRALDRIDLVVEDGERVAVLGPNGSGKSTLALLANGMLVPRRGRVLVDGMDTADSETTWAVRSSVGLVFQNPENQIVATTVEEDVAFGPENLGLERSEIRRRVDRAIKAVGLDGLARREPHLLSGGQKQRLAIAGALALEPRHLVLDEPTAMLDPVGRRDVLEVLRRLQTAGVTMIQITHRLDEALLADRAVVLSQGGVRYDGPPHGLLEDMSALPDWGIALPPLIRLTREIRERTGMEIDYHASPDRIVEAVCR